MCAELKWEKAFLFSSSNDHLPLRLEGLCSGRPASVCYSEGNPGKKEEKMLKEG